jgi:hypothetical protein
MRFEEADGQLIKLHSLAKINLDWVASFYDWTFPKSDATWFDKASFNEETGTRLGRLIPIPTAWAALFLDYPNVGTALQRIWALISLAAIGKLDNFKLLTYSMAYACCLLPGMVDYTSVLATDWKRLPHSKPNTTWRREEWQASKDSALDMDFDEGDSVKDLKLPPEDIRDPFMTIFGGGRQPQIIFPGQQTRNPTSWGGSPYGARVHHGTGQHTPSPSAARHGGAKASTGARMMAQQGTGHSATHHAATHPVVDIGAFMATMLQAQTDNQLAIAAASHTNMVAFHMAMAQAIATKAGDKDSKMTTSK